VIYQTVHRLRDDFDRGKVNGDLIMYIHGLSDVRVVNSIILNSNAYYHQVVLTSIFAIKTRYIVTLCLPRNVATRMGV
jgi:hypothetical protein